MKLSISAGVKNYVGASAKAQRSVDVALKAQTEAVARASV